MKYIKLFEYRKKLNPTLRPPVIKYEIGDYLVMHNEWTSVTSINLFQPELTMKIKRFPICKIIHINENIQLPATTKLWNYIVESIEINTYKITKSFVSNSEILRKSTPKEEKEYDTYREHLELLSIANKYNL